MKKVYLLFTLVAVSIAISVSAQKGNEFFEDNDYYTASQHYEKEAKSDPALYFKLAQCYFALKDFDNAIVAIQKYLEKDPNADKKKGNEWLELLQRNDDPVEVTNMGSIINSSAGEGHPVISRDGKTLYFTGDEKAGGYGGEDVWFTTKDSAGEWTKPRPFVQLNTGSHEAMQSISGDETFAIVFGNYDGTFGGGDLFYSVQTDEGWSTPCNLGGVINDGKWQSQANLAADGKTLVYCSEYDGGFGEGDIYMTRLEDDNWTKPINLGSTVNTADHEMSPFLAADGKTLYFSSPGHGGFGKDDIFVTRRLDDSWINWSKPKNLGKYINTMDRDLYMAVPSSGNIGYTAKNTPDGYGLTDVYEFLLPMDMRPEPVFNVYGWVTNEADSAAGIVIRYIDMETGKEVAKASSDFVKGGYQVSLTPQKKYKVIIDMKGYLYYEEILDLSNPDYYLSKETIQDKMKDQMAEIRALQNKYDQLAKGLDEMIGNQTNDIKQGFEDWKNLYTEYNETSKKLEHTINEARFEWMSESNDKWSLQRDYEVQRIKVGAKFELKNIFFDVGKGSLRKESKESLDELVSIMEKSDITIELGGHTDNTGSDESNLALSQERVNSVQTYLVNKGINASRITAVGYGEAQPVATNDTEEGRQKNRRVEVKITQINQKGGSGEYEKIDKKKKKEEEPEEISSLDLLFELQRAGKNGGLPKGSNCSDKVDYLATGKTLYDPDNASGPDLDLSSIPPLTRDKNIYKSFNAYVANKGFDFADGSKLGAGVIFTDKELHEQHIELFFKGGDTAVAFAAKYGNRWFVQLNESGLPLSVMSGIDVNLMGVRPGAFVEAISVTDTSEINSLKMKGYITMPLGLRYTKEIKGIIIAPEVSYDLGLIKLQHKYDLGNGEGEEQVKIKSGVFRIGANARWTIFHAGLFFNAGKVEHYGGFQAGLTF